MTGVHCDLDDGAQEGRARLEATRRAYSIIPEQPRSRILDVGCGRGGPTLELARLGGGLITCLDTHQRSLDVLASRARDQGLAGRVQILRCSMLNIALADGCFDVVWAEGAIFVVGFSRGLREWRRLIRPGGFLVVHDMVWLTPGPPKECEDHFGRMFPGLQGVKAHLEAIPRAGYKLLEHFCVPEEVWWQDYYGPREERIVELRQEHAGDPGALAQLDSVQQAIDLYRQCARWFGSAFFVMRRMGQG